MRTYRFWSLVLAAVVAASAILPAGAAADAPEAFTQDPQAELLLLEVQVGRLSLDGDLLPAYRVAGGVLISLGQLSRLLELGLTVLPEQGRAEGLVGRDARRFLLDAARGMVSVGRDRTSFDSARVRIDADDIYVDASLLSQWLPMELEVDFPVSVLRVKPREPLPVELRLERESRWRELRSGQPFPEAPYPHLQKPYRLLAGPFVDPSLRLSLRRDVQGEQQTHAQYTVFATGELLQMTGAVFLSGNESDPLSALRFTLGRKQPEATLLGPLKAREFSLGHVIYPGLPLVSSPKVVRGVHVSSYLLRQPEEFDRIQLEGALPPGWAVELYRDDLLLDFQQPGPDARYRFENVPLRYGQNEFRLIFYGPQGQIREEVRRWHVRDSLVPPGDSYYRVTVGESEDGKERVFFQYDEGVGRHLSAGLALSRTLGDFGEDGYATLSLRGWSGEMLTQADVALAEGGGSAGRLALHTRWGRVGTSLEHVRLWGFSSEKFPAGADPIESQTRWTLDSTLPFPASPGLALSWEVQQDRLRSGEALTHLSGRVSSSYNGLSLTNWLDASVRRAEVSAQGTLLMARHLGRYTARADLRYDLEPLAQVRQVSISVNGSLAGGYTFQLQMDRSIDTNRSRYAVDLVRNAGTYAAGIGAEYRTSGEVGLRLSLSTALGREGHSGEWRAAPSGTAHMGAVSARAFVDANENGVMDPGEVPIEGVAFLVNGSVHPARTDEKGVAMLTGLTPYHVNIVELSPATLEDPMWRPAVQGFGIIPRPGATLALDYPVIVAGEVSGTAYLLHSDGARQVSGMELELVNPQGEVVTRTKSAFDGFFLFEDVRPGDYEVRIAPSQVARLGLKPVPPQPVHVPADGSPVEEVRMVAEVAQPATGVSLALEEGLPIQEQPAIEERPLVEERHLVEERPPTEERVLLPAEEGPAAIEHPPEGETPAETPVARAARVTVSRELVIYAWPGDTPSQIAWDFAMPLEAILGSNPGLADAHRIGAGQEVRIPGLAAEPYVIQRQDTLFSIARAHGIRLAGLLRMNPQITDPDRIASGQAIWVPVPRGRPYDIRPYTVQRADTLFSIARTYGVTTEELLRLNPQIADARRIVVGQTVWVPSVEKETITEAPKAATNAPAASPELVIYARAGDTPSQIAWDFAMPVEALLRSNPRLTDGRIGAGQKVRIPGLAAESYTIQRGDTLFSIARARGIRLAGLLRMNPQITDPDRIVSGQAIRVPVPYNRPYAVQPYTVQRGDTFFSIARAHGVTVEELLRLNPQIVDARRIVVGQTVWVSSAKP
ncbi:MAG: LysM peptidoglycan-binding domain-containing protein [Bacillota bacterium]